MPKLEARNCKRRFSHYTCCNLRKWGWSQKSIKNGSPNGIKKSSCFWGSLEGPGAPCRYVPGLAGIASGAGSVVVADMYIYMNGWIYIYIFIHIFLTFTQIQVIHIQMLRFLK